MTPATILKTAHPMALALCVTPMAIASSARGGRKMKTGFCLAVITDFVLSLVRSTPVTAEMRSVTLGVGMYCVSCAYIVEQTLEAVPGVSRVKVSRRQQMAVVTFDDTVTEISALVAATENVGYETTVLSTTRDTETPLDRLRRLSLQPDAPQRNTR